MIRQQELVFARFLEQRRKSQKFSQAQMAQKLGYNNVNKGIRRIADIESGNMNEDLIPKIIAILNVTEEDRQKCLLAEELSRKRLVKRLPQFKPMLIWRALSCINCSEPIPDYLTSNPAKLFFAQNFAREKHRHCRLELNYNLRYYISPAGEISKPDKRLARLEENIRLFCQGLEGALRAQFKPVCISKHS